MDTIHTSAALAGIGNKANGAGLSATLLGWLVSNEVLAVAGFIVAVLGFLVTWYYKRKEYRLKERETEQRLKYEQLKYQKLEEELKEDKDE